MNRYGKKFGFHTPQMSEQNKDFIESMTKVKFIDTSWHNDLCDSIANEELNIQIFLPNSDIEDFHRELFNTFCIASLDGEREYPQYEGNLYTLDELVNPIKLDKNRSK